MIAAVPQKLMDQMGRLFSVNTSIRRVFLYGSRARGDAESRSDIDLAIEAPSASQREWLEVYFSLEDLDTLLEIDAIRWEEAPEALKRNILSEGQILYERCQEHPESEEP